MTLEVGIDSPELEELLMRLVERKEAAAAGAS